MAENYNNTPYTNGYNKAESEELNFGPKDIVFFFIAKWYYFLISVLVALAIGVLYIGSQHPLYKANACLIINQDKRTGSSGLEASSSNFSNMGRLFASQTNVNNEIIAFESPMLMKAVVKELDLRADYTMRHRLYKKSLYGTTLPVRLMFQDVPDRVSFTANILYQSDSTVLVDNIQVGDYHPASILAKFNEPCELVVNENTSYVFVAVPRESATLVLAPFEPIEFTYLTEVAASGRYAAGFSASLTDKEATAVTLAMADKSPERARDVLSSLIGAYNKKWVDDRNQIIHSTSEFISGRLAIIAAELGTVDQEMTSYMSENQLISPESTGSMYLNKAERIQDEMLTLSINLNIAEYVKQYLKDPANAYRLLPSGSGIDNNGIETMITEYNSALITRNNLLANSTADNPVIIKQTMNLDSMHENIVESVNNYILTLNHRLNVLQTTSEGNVKKISSSPKQMEHLTDIDRQRKIKESLYLYLLQKREENDLSQDFVPRNTRILQDPIASSYPFSPRKQRILLIAFLIGLVVPIAALYVYEITNTKVRNRFDVEVLDLPFVGEIPLALTGKRRFVKAADTKLADQLVVKPGNRDVINEAFRVVRSNLEFLSTGKGSVIELTSFNVSSGKSFISVNLSTAMAIMGKKVVAVDLDLRKAKLSESVGSPHHGVRDFLAGKVDDLDSLIVKNKIVEGLDVIPVGTIPPNPSELLYSRRMQVMIDKLKEEYDYIFLDCPPVNIVADPTIVNKYADRTLFIIRAGLMEKELLPSVEMLSKNNQLKGMLLLLNGTSDPGVTYYRKYGYAASHNRYGKYRSYSRGYGRGYGYGYGDGKSYYGETYGATSADNDHKII